MEIAFFDRGPIDDEDLVTGGFWSTYWYNGRIYGTEIVRGLDVLALLPSEYLSEYEIAAARVADQGDVFNPQQQFRVTWPAEPVVARAYVDQLERDNALPTSLVTDLTGALEGAERALEKGTRSAELAASLGALAQNLETGGGGLESRRRAALAGSLRDIAARIH